MGAYTYKTSDLLVTSIEKNEIKQNSPETLPLNPTGQGFSGQEVRRRLSHSIVGEEGSLLSLFTMRMQIAKDILDNVFEQVENLKNDWLYGWVQTDSISSIGLVDLKAGEDTTFTKNLTSLTINIPFECKHGFYSGVNFKTSGDELPIVINNYSFYPLKIIKYNLEFPSIQLQAFKAVNVSFYCDGINVYCRYSEINL